MCRLKRGLKMRKTPETAIAGVSFGTWWGLCSYLTSQVYYTLLRPNLQPLPAKTKKVPAPGHFILHFLVRCSIIKKGNINCGRLQGVGSTLQPCTSEQPTQHSNRNCTTAILYPFFLCFASPIQGVNRCAFVKMVLAVLGNNSAPYLYFREPSPWAGLPSRPARKGKRKNIFY